MNPRFVRFAGALVATLAACAEDGTGPKDPEAPPPTRIVVQAYTDHPSALHMGDTVTAVAYRLDRRGLPIAPDTARFVWSSSDTTVLMVDSSALVTVVGLGSAELIARLRDTGAVLAPLASDTASGHLTLSGAVEVIDAGPVLAAAIGGSHECILRTGGLAFCRGHNERGQLGNGTTSTAVSADWTPVSGGYSFASISGGSSHNCALTSDQRAFCWGSAYRGALGNGTTALLAVPTPTEIAGRRWSALDAGGHGATCAVQAADSVPYCFGHNDVGQTGHTPVALSDTVVAPIGGTHKMRMILTEHFYTCGLEIDGSVYCSGWWGPPTNTVDPSDGELGGGVPTRIGGTTPLTSISIGYSHGCGLTAAGAAYCWGDNWLGQLGTADTLASGSLRAVAGAPAFRSIHVAEFTSCGITDAGEVWCWGSNGGSELGRTSARLQKSKVPIRVRIGEKMKWIQAGDEKRYAMCGITESAKLVCWGGA